MLSFNVKCAIQVLAELEKAKVAGKRVTVTDLKVLCGMEGQSVSVVMSRLRRKYWVESSSNRYYMIIDLTGSTLYDLVLAVDDKLGMGHNVLLESWPYQSREKYEAAIELDEQLSAAMAQRLKEIPLTKLFECYNLTGHKLPHNVRKRAAGAKIIDGGVVFENKY